MFFWNEEKIRFLRDASEYTPFHETLAEKAAPCFPPGARVCDAGCGLGYLSLALAPLCGHVTAVDVSGEALAVLAENLRRRGTGGITVCRADVFSLPGDLCFDGMIFCFFGRTGEILRCAKRHCRGKAVIFKRSGETHRFALRPAPLERLPFAQTCAELDALGIAYAGESFALEMGQPFRSLAEAAAFFRLYSPGPGGTDPSEESLRARLQPTGRADFPYYLPSARPVGMLVVDTGEIPDTIK